MSCFICRHLSCDPYMRHSCRRTSCRSWRHPIQFMYNIQEGLHMSSLRYKILLETSLAVPVENIHLGFSRKLRGDNII